MGLGILLGSQLQNHLTLTGQVLLSFFVLVAANEVPPSHSSMPMGVIAATSLKPQIQSVQTPDHKILALSEGGASQTAQSQTHLLLLASKVGLDLLSSKSCWLSMPSSCKQLCLWWVIKHFWQHVATLSSMGLRPISPAMNVSFLWATSYSRFMNFCRLARRVLRCIVFCRGRRWKKAQRRGESASLGRKGRKCRVCDRPCCF